MFRLGDTWVVPTNIVTITDLHIEEEKFETNSDYYKKIAQGKINGMLAEKIITKDKLKGKYVYNKYIDAYN